MHLSNYRFNLAEDTQLPDAQKAAKRVEDILYQKKSLDIQRVSLDLTSCRKSISLLSKAKNPQEFHAQVTQLLSMENLTITDMEIDEIYDEEETCPHHDHGHHHDDHEDHHEHHHHHAHKHDHEDHHGHHHSHEHHNHSHGHDHSHGNDSHWSKAALGLIWGLGLLVLSVGGFSLPIAIYYGLTGLTSLVTLYLGRTIYQSAWRNLFKGNWDTSTLYTISTLTILIVSLASLFIPGLPMIFEAAPLVLGFWHLGEGIEHSLIEEITKTLDVRDCIPPLVHLNGNPGKDVSVKTLIPNDRISVKAGKFIPVDGLLKEDTLLYTTKIDGSPSLREFKAGDEVYAGMQLAEHIESVEMQVTKTYANSYLSSIAKNISKANEQKAPVEIFADTILKYFIPGLLGVALVSGIVIGTFVSPALALQCVISVLVSACPCALSLITPLAVKIGMKKAAEQGVHFKDGKTLQAAAGVNTIVFDLNGTLTQGKGEVQALRFVDKKLLSQVSLLESYSDHADAKLIKSYIDAQGYEAPLKIDFDTIDKSHNGGIKAVIDGERIIIGNKEILKAYGITQIDKPYDNPENGTTYVVRGETVVGQISILDKLREDAIATVKQLKAQGLDVHICTGASVEKAEQYAALLGIPKDNICANATGKPEKDRIAKEEFIQKLKRAGRKVAMIGDATNDLSAIANADIGVAVRSSIGDEMTEQNAGIVVQQGLLFAIAVAFDVAAKTKQNIVQNLLISLTYNSLITLVAAGLFVSIGLTLNPALGVAFMVLESTLVLANLYRLQQQKIVAPANPAEPTAEECHEHTTAKVLDMLSYRPKLEKAEDLEEVDTANYTTLISPSRKPSLSDDRRSEVGLGAVGF